MEPMTNPTSANSMPVEHASVSHEEALSLLEVALTAPSGDNTQPWKLVSQDWGFDIYHHELRARSPFNPGDLASRLALGALLETARIEGMARGLRLVWRLDPNHESPLHWARVWWSQTAPRREPLRDAIANRCTNRDRFDGRPLPIDIVQALSCGDSVRLVRSPAQLQEIAAIVARASGLRARSRACHESLHEWLRWSPADADRTRDGLDVRTLGLGAVARAALRFSKARFVARLLTLLGGAWFQARYTRVLLGTASAIGVVTASSLTPSALVSAGIAMQRIWLSATRLGLAFSPVCDLVILEHGDARDPSFLSRRARRVFAALYARLKTCMGIPVQEHAVFMFRLGYAPTPEVRSLRRAVHDLLDLRLTFRPTADDGHKR